MGRRPSPDCYYALVRAKLRLVRLAKSSGPYRYGMCGLVGEAEISATRELSRSMLHVDFRQRWL